MQLAGLQMTARAFLGSVMSQTLGSLPARDLPLRPSSHDVQQLVALRTLSIVAYAVTLVVLYHVAPEPIPTNAIAAVLVALAAFNFAIWRRLNTGRLIADYEPALHLLIDVGAPAVLLTMSGGASGGFTGLFALPLALTVANLSWWYSGFTALTALVCCLLGAIALQPLFGNDEDIRQQLAATAIWINFAIAAGIVSRWVLAINDTQRRSARKTTDSPEREACEERVALIGTLAAGAAHELAQPLASLSVVVGELQRRCAGRDELRDDLAEVSRHLRHCQETLGTLLSHGKRTLDGPAEWEDLDRFACKVLDAFRARRHAVPARLRVQPRGRPPLIRCDPALRQALRSLLCNAADASPHFVEFGIAWDDEEIRLTVLDDGPGISPEVEKKIGQLFFTTKPNGKGNGLGLFIAQTAVARLGGSLRLFNTRDRGACAEVVLPVRTMSRDAGPHKGSD